MATYVVGDVQGCLAPLKALLKKVGFNSDRDLLISVGDLINRGPKSLETIRFCMSLGESFKMVLGNHDLHLLAMGEGVREPSPKDTIQDILDAPDRPQILDWLRSHPLLLNIQSYHIVHAGIPPIWSIEQAHSLAAEVSRAIQSDHRKSYFENMYGNTPDIWQEQLQGPERLRVITNYLTRMRFCTHKGQLDLTTKKRISMPEPFNPWFSYQRSEPKPVNIVFGHWAALKGNPWGSNLFALDTGYVWGGQLRMMALESQQLYHQPPIK